MRIEEERVYVFRFPYETTELAIPVRAQTQEEAGIKLRKILSDIQMDLAMEFPTVAVPKAPTVLDTMPTSNVTPTLLLDLKIEEYLRRLDANFVTDDDKVKIIKQWTKLDFIPANYEAIAKSLEELLNENGKKEGKS
jgi:hypothetical protein